MKYYKNEDAAIAALTPSQQEARKTVLAAEAIKAQCKHEALYVVKHPHGHKRPLYCAVCLDFIGYP